MNNHAGKLYSKRAALFVDVFTCWLEVAKVSVELLSIETERNSIRTTAAKLTISERD